MQVAREEDDGVEGLKERRQTVQEEEGKDVPEHRDGSSEMGHGPGFLSQAGRSLPLVREKGRCPVCWWKELVETDSGMESCFNQDKKW